MNGKKTQVVNRVFKPKRILGVIALLGLVLPGINAVSSAANPLQIELGTSANYILLAQTAITNGATTIISGTGGRVVGISPGVSDVGTVDSFIASGASEFQNGTVEPTLAQSDLQIAIASLSSLTPQVVSANLSLADNATIYPGVYTTPGGVAMSIDQDLILDAQGDSDAIFVFVTPAAFNTTAGITVFLQDGAQASNIYWVVGAALTMGASTHISGNFLVSAATTIGASSTVQGRILCQGAVTLGASVVLTSSSAAAPNPLQPPIELGTSANYILLVQSAITNGATTIISGSGSRVVGISPGLSAAGTVDSFIASGASEFQNGTGDPALAQSDLQNAIASARSLTPQVVNANLSLADNATIYPGVYTTPGGAAMSIDQDLILDALGDPDAIFVFVTPAAFDTTAGITVILQNGAQASNIYWVVGGAVTMGASTHISGNFLTTGATTIGASSTVQGRILSQDVVTLGASVVLTS